MSHIPNSAMPHAAPSDSDAQQEQGGTTLAERAGKLGDLARDNPKTAIAAGAALAAGALAAAAIPLVRSRRAASAGGKSGGSKKSGGKGKAKA